MRENFHWDAFISYASEDRVVVAEPLAEVLRNCGISVWIDRTELKLGDSLRKKIDEGLAKSRYGIAILSPSFFEKHFPYLELNGLAQREVDGKKTILPIWHGVTVTEVRRFSLPLADRIAANWNDGVTTVAKQIIEIVRPDIIEKASQTSDQSLMPRITSGSEIISIIRKSHSLNISNENASSPQELDLISRFAQDIQDESDIINELDVGDQIREEYRLNEVLKEPEAMGWSVHGRCEHKQLKTNKSDWFVARIAIVRGTERRVYSIGDNNLII